MQYLNIMYIVPVYCDNAGPRAAASISGSTLSHNSVRNGGSGGALWLEDGAQAVLQAVELQHNAAFSSFAHR